MKDNEEFIIDDAFVDVFSGIMNYRREHKGTNPSKVTVNWHTLQRIKASPEAIRVMPFVSASGTFEDHFKKFLGVPFECVPDQKNEITIHP